MASGAVIRRRFLDEYRASLQEIRAKAELLGKFIEEALSDSRIDVHKIEARAKDPDSLHLKLLRKGYKRPRIQLTDSVGARIITYYPTDVDPVVEVLRAVLEIDKRNSVDKRRALGTRAFGYSSVHLIAKVKQKYLRKPEYRSLSGLKFEVQVRSILEHAWAEIEHEVVFKSGVLYPKEIDRQFSAIAGTLEVLGRGFLSLRGERNKLIQHYKEQYRHRLDLHKSFDSARLLGFLEFRYPDAISWRLAESQGSPFPTRIEAVCIAALRACHLNTGSALRSLMSSGRFRRAVRTYAAISGIELAKVSHLALTLIAIGLRNVRVLHDYFPQLSQDPGLRAVAP